MIFFFSGTVGQICKQDPSGVLHILSEWSVPKCLFCKMETLFYFVRTSSPINHFFSGEGSYGRRVTWSYTEVIKSLNL